MDQQWQQLQELLDKKACEDVLLRYGRTLDWLDQAGQENCFWPDATIDYGFFQGSGADWIPAVMQVEAASSRRWHLSSGVLVQVTGDKAKSECYGLSVGAVDNEQGELVNFMFGGRYLDELEKRDGQWRISSRSYFVDWLQQFPGGLETTIGGDLMLKVLQIQSPGHALYRPL
jgi:hypothetical protein